MWPRHACTLVSICGHFHLPRKHVPAHYTSTPSLPPEKPPGAPACIPVLLRVASGCLLTCCPAALACRYRSLSQETSAEGCRSSALQQALAEEHTAANASLYVLLRATDRFHIAHGRYPGSFDSAVEDDVAVLKSIAVQLLQELGVSGPGVQVGRWAGVDL
jgi:hypothetical protein